MGQPGMRVTVDAAMRARDVSRPGIAPDPGEVSSGPPAHSEAATEGRRGVRGMAERDDTEGRPQRDRRGKGERRRLSKRHARAPR
jgi:hypothetical protein